MPRGSEDLQITQINVTPVRTACMAAVLCYFLSPHPDLILNPTTFNVFERTLATSYATFFDNDAPNFLKVQVIEEKVPSKKGTPVF